MTQAQQTYFYDTFGTSTINGLTNATITSTNMLPGGTPTASWTSYEIGSGKNATATTNLPGHLLLFTTHTTSGNSEAQALFTQNPVTLAQIGDYIELDYTFTDTTNIYNGLCGNGVGLDCGLFYSGGVAPYSGTLLWNGGFSTSSVNADTAGTKNWLGYFGEMWNSLTSATAWTISSRPAQTSANNSNQQLLYNSSMSPGGSTHNSANPATIPSPLLTPGSQYTAQFRITLSTNGSLTVSNAMYAGTGTTGAMVYSNFVTYTGANLLTTNFDGLAVGYRAGDSSSTAGWTNDINNITVLVNLAANQAGPYYSVISSGNPCSGGLTIGLNGSTTTNIYYLYRNGVNSGLTPIAGTGSSIGFAAQTTPGAYTVIASNTVTARLGTMLGTANVYASGISIALEPGSVSVVSNVPASFSVQAVGAALSYQWYANGAALANSANISGVQSSNLVLGAPTGANAASGANGYYCVITDPCGDISTTAPPASLTVTAPRNLKWVGNNPDNSWEFGEQNFSLSGSPTTFNNGDSVTFDDTANTTQVAVTNNVISTLVTVNSANGYTFSGAGAITGFGQLVDEGPATLNIYNNNTYTGGTTISNGATLQLGDGNNVGNNGSLSGVVTIASGGTLEYNFAGSYTSTANLNHSLAGSGTVSANTGSGSTIATLPTGISSNFTGTINIAAYSVLHASDNNSGYALGNGSTVNVPDGAQAWLDRSSTAYNNNFNIGGTGWPGATPQTGALRIFGNVLNGSIVMTDNARIGGSINGGTLQGVVSGPYQLEVWGTTNSFILVMGATNGQPQAYNSTLITAGSIQAAGTNAISPGPMTLDSGGDLRLYGYNLSVSNLSSINSGNIQLIEGPRVRNMNTTNNAVLTVGADGTSTEFDGTFSDGSTGTFGLTKVGAGSLTLTLLSTNTGPVTVLGGSILMNGSGSFSKAPIFTGSGGIYDVSNAGGTLTLSSGQTVGGNGEVNGNLSAPSGSIVWPGLPLGTLTINSSSSSTVNGTYRASLNRTNTPGNCSQIATSGGGSLSFSGATLSVTNLGPALQVGDLFQLFPGATAGFSTANLEPYDYANKVNYTWNNQIAGSGYVSVATVVSRVLALQTAPTISAITYGQAISNSIISSGSVTNASGTVVAGTYVFSTPGTTPLAGTTNQTVTFTPTDTTDYNAFTFTAVVTVNKQTPVLKTAPTASTITNGNALSLSILTGGVVTNAYNTNTVAGTIAWTTPSTVPPTGTDSESVTFTPTDTADYNTFTFNVNVTVVAGTSAPTALKFSGRPTISGNTLTFSATNTGGGTFYLLGSTNLSSPAGTWAPIWTNVAGGSSSFTTNLNVVNPALGKQFFILSSTN